MKKLFFALSLILATFANAQTIFTDRPSQTDNSSTLPKGRFQVEAGILGDHDPKDTVLFSHYVAPTVLLHYGISDKIEIRLVDQYESNKYSGLADLQLGTKIQVCKKEDSNIEIAFLTHLSIPTGDNEISYDSLWVINKLAGSLKLNERIALGYTLGYYYGNIISGQVSYSLLLGIGLGQNLSVFAETYGNTIAASSTPSINADVGLAYLIKDNLQIDLYSGTGINNQMKFVSAGLSWYLMRN